MSFMQMYRDQHAVLPVTCTEANCKGKTFIVTGANTGLGFEAAKHLIRCRSERVILAVRSLERGEEAKRRIEADTSVAGVAEVWQLELSSYDSIKAFVKKVEQLERLDAIIENAGVAAPDFTLSEGYETTITVNVIGTFLLAALVLPKLRATAKKTGQKTDLTIVGSGAGFYAVGLLEKMDKNKDILQALSKQDGSWNMEQRYPLSKLIQLYVLREFAKANPVSDGVVISYINPGLCRTELGRNAGIMFKIQLRVLWAIMGRTAEEGSRTLLHGGFADEGCHGKYLSECEKRDHYCPDWVTNESGQLLQQRLWNELKRILNSITPGCV